MTKIREEMEFELSSVAYFPSKEQLDNLEKLFRSWALENEAEIITRLRRVILPEEVPAECYKKVIDYLEAIGFFKKIEEAK